MCLFRMFYITFVCLLLQLRQKVRIRLCHLVVAYTSSMKSKPVLYFVKQCWIHYNTCVVAIIDNKKVTILNTLGKLDFYNQIVLQSMSPLHVQFLCEILLDIVTVCMYLCISGAFLPHVCIFVLFTVTSTCESCYSRVTCNGRSHGRIPHSY